MLTHQEGMAYSGLKGTLRFNLKQQQGGLSIRMYEVGCLFGRVCVCVQACVGGVRMPNN